LNNDSPEAFGLGNADVITRHADKENHHSQQSFGAGNLTSGQIKPFMTEEITGATGTKILQYI